MECSCEIDVYDGDGESVELYNEERRTAKKQHKCFECGGAILPGYKYKFVSYLYEGRFWMEKTCTDCLSAIEQFYPRGGWAGVLWDEISEHVNCAGGDLPESCLAQLSPIARAKVCDMVDAHHAER